MSENENINNLISMLEYERNTSKDKEIRIAHLEGKCQAYELIINSKDKLQNQTHYKYEI